MKMQKYISFRVNDNEYDFVQEYAKANGLKISSFMRLCLNEFMRVNDVR